MRQSIGQSIGRLSSAILEKLLPSATAHAGCDAPYCQVNSTKTKHRCCHFCSPGGTLCGSWINGSCSGIVCPR
jgi:hypothetical protein